MERISGISMSCKAIKKIKELVDKFIMINYSLHLYRYTFENVGLVQMADDYSYIVVLNLKLKESGETNKVHHFMGTTAR